MPKCCRRKPKTRCQKHSAATFKNLLAPIKKSGSIEPLSMKKILKTLIKQELLTARGGYPESLEHPRWYPSPLLL